MSIKEIKIKYMSEDHPRIEKIDQGDWIDLRVNTILKHWHSKEMYNTDRQVGNWSDIQYKKGDILLLGLGVAMELPKGYEAITAPRSSTFKNTGLILTNSIGVIDESYCGDDDEWKAMVYATRNGMIRRHDRLFQFRIQENQPMLIFNEVKELGNKNRGGYGSTGR